MFAVLLETNSVECQMSRRQVRSLWQMQYELADGLALFFLQTWYVRTKLVHMFYNDDKMT